jgi:hypothetical protein
MSNMTRLSIPITPAAVLAAPRHLWLATLGAAAVTREWAERDAATMFRSLVKEGSVVETRALNQVGKRIGTSMKRANALARTAKVGVRSSIESLASAASTFVRTKLPTVRARLDVQSAGVKRKPAAKTVKAASGSRTSRRSTKSRARK